MLAYTRNSKAQPVSKFAAKSVINPLYSEAEECERAEELAMVMRRLTGNPMTLKELASDMGLTQQQADSLVDDLRTRKLATVSRNNGKIKIVGWWRQENSTKDPERKLPWRNCRQKPVD